jgi:hypothetical protein
MIDAFVNGDAVEPGAYLCFTFKCMGFVPGLNKHILCNFFCIFCVLQQVQRRVVHPWLVLCDEIPESLFIVTKTKHADKM